MARFWTCKKCRARNPRVKGNCPTPGCAGKRPKPTRPAHRAVMDIPYEKWVERFGEQCGICGRGRTETRRLDRDHNHKTGEMRGLLCSHCNQQLPRWVTVDWMLRATSYLQGDGEGPHV